MPRKQKKTKTWKFTKAKMLILGSFLFSLGVVTSVTSTYAWFTLTSMGAISNLNLTLNYDTSFALYLSPNRESVDTSLSVEELLETGALIHEEGGYSREQLGIEGIELNDVSGMFQSKWLNDETIYDQTLLPKLRTAPRFWTADVDASVDPGETNERDTFVQNVFYLQAGEDCSIYLDGSKNEETGDLNTYVRANLAANQKVADETGRDVNKLNKVVNAVRVSFLTTDGYVIADPGDTYETTYYAGLLDTGVTGYYDVKDGYEVMYGEYLGEVRYVENERHDEKFENGDVFTSNHMPGVQIVDPEQLEDPGNSDLHAVKEEAVSLESLSYDSTKGRKYTPLCTLRKGELKRIVVTIYVEGWDRDMTDAIASASFDIALSFIAVYDQY